MSQIDQSHEVDLPIHQAELSQERKDSIQNALRRYRHRVLELNMFTLTKAIEAAESISPSRRDPHSGPEELSKLRVERLYNAHGIRLEPPDPKVESVRDFLSEDKRQALISSCRLDGIKHGDVDIVAREAWIDRTEEAILTTTRARVRPDGLPAELKYLMTLTRALCGFGLPRYRFYGELRQLKFLSDVEGDEEEFEDGTEAGLVAVPETPEDIQNGDVGDILDEWADCEVALAVVVGLGGFAVYCRRKDQGGRTDDATWSWKYGLLDYPYESELYDCIEDFLDFYAEHNKEVDVASAEEY